MRKRLVLLTTALLLASACGVSRDGDTVAERTTTSAAVSDDTTSDETTSETTVTTAAPAAPNTTAAAGEVAVTVQFADGSSSEVLHGALNDIVGPTTVNDEFVALVYQGQVPPGFDAIVLSQTVLGEVLANELSTRDTETTTADRDEAELLLVQQLEGLLATSPDPAADAERLITEVPYLPFIVELQARQIALSNQLAATAQPGEGNPCVRHILVETEAEGDDLQAELADGADFAELAIERSTGPTGPDGGDLGCAPASNYVPEFAAAVEESELGVPIGPVETQFGWHVLLVESYEVNGDQLAQDVLNEGLIGAAIDVDERVGAWDVDRLTIIPAAAG